MGFSSVVESLFIRLAILSERFLTVEFAAFNFSKLQFSAICSITSLEISIFKNLAIFLTASARF